MEKIIRKSINAVLVIMTILLVSSCMVGRYMCNYALLPEEHGNDIEGDRAKTEKRYPGIIKWYDGLREAGIYRDSTLIGEGGCRLYYEYVSASDPSTAQGTALVVHGYTDNHICFLNLVRMYRDSLNYNVLVPDLHHHGFSEGDAVQMGWYDRLDAMRFIEEAHGIFGDDFMVMHGVSMGGATTMMTSGEDLPGYVKAFVDDCGYSSVWDQYTHNLKQMFHLPPFPVLHSASIVCKHRYGWTFKEASSMAQLAKCERPMLFIHGDKDDFVPTAHVYKNYDAKVKGYKELWLAPGSEHAMAYKDHPAEYTQHVRDFLAKVKSMSF
ncbi:MAG: alpha/beta hydrolase [Bacteroidales bacterium]|nr:alpha/beta hydrolase [Bacteroidales bacterium]